MRPGLVFVGLFAVLILMYVLLQDSLGSFWTFMLQAALVLVILAGAAWFRYAKKPKGWLFFGDDEKEDEDEDRHDGTGGQSGEPPQFRKAS